MSQHLVFPCVLLLELAACSPEVHVGSDVVLDDGETRCEPVTAASAGCPATPWGTKRGSLASLENLEQQLVGKWAFCGGERRYTGRGPLEGFSPGSGVELWNDSGQLRFAFLRGTVPTLVRKQGSGASGTVRLQLENGRGRAVLAADDGQEVVWPVDFFEGQRVMQNAAFDVWNFVPVE